ncbi:uncharacterized protein [Clytia hemisphaerica]|uniref:C-type lectin domain-containing protein n=1 Tax=Clytia hemisphaerica TaxID=252671 RepID=A0A7M5VA03_9CNID
MKTLQLLIALSSLVVFANCEEASCDDNSFTELIETEQLTEKNSFCMPCPGETFDCFYRLIQAPDVHEAIASCKAWRGTLAFRDLDTSEVTEYQQLMQSNGLTEANAFNVHKICYILKSTPPQEGEQLFTPTTCSDGVSNTFLCQHDFPPTFVGDTFELRPSALFGPNMEYEYVEWLQASYLDALKYCERIGKELLTIESLAKDEEMNALLTALDTDATITLDIRSAIWNSLAYNPAVGGKWKWPSGITSPYRNFCNGEPADLEGRESTNLCLRYFWGDKCSKVHPCFNTAHFVCQNKRATPDTFLTLANVVRQMMSDVKKDCQSCRKSH